MHDSQVNSRIIGGRVRQWRLARGLSQAELARRAGVTQASVSNYETGKRDLSLALALRLAAALDITLADITRNGDIILLRDSRLGRALLQSLLS